MVQALRVENSLAVSFLLRSNKNFRALFVIRRDISIPVIIPLGAIPLLLLFETFLLEIPLIVALVAPSRNRVLP